VSELPASWEKVRLIDLVESTLYGPRFSASDYKSDGVPTVRTTDMDEDGRIGLRDPPRVSVSAGELARLGLIHNDLLVTRTGSIGRCALYKSSLGPALPSAYLIRVRLKPEACDPEYVLRFMVSPEGQEHLVGASTAVTQPNVNAQAIGAMSLPMPPIAEQRRIVARIDALTEQSRRAREALADVPALLERFRQSVLAAAFRGDLTADWREKNPSVEPAEELLKRLRAERRRRWEDAELARMQAKGKAPGDDRWKEKYEAPAPVNPRELPELPEGWAWAKLEALANLINGDRGENYPSQASLVETGIPFINAGHLDNGRIDFSTMSYITEERFAALGGGKVRSGDVLYCLRGSLGKAAVVENVDRGAIASSLVIIRPAEPILSELIYWFLVSPPGKALIRQYDNGSTQPNLAARSVQRYDVPVPPEAEMRQIIAKISAAFKRIAVAEASSREALGECRRLERALLAKAFRGELVPQDPNDEPASVLLERIRAQAAPARSRG
jgi:type I restriction enzyme S subunit